MHTWISRGTENDRSRRSAQRWSARSWW